MTNMLNVHLHHIHNELDLYNHSHDEVYLMEAGEKVWVAYKFLLEQLSGTKIHSHETTRALSHVYGKNNARLRQLYEIADDLHRFHYAGRGDYNIIVEKIHRAENLLNIEINQYNSKKVKMYDK